MMTHTCVQVGESARRCAGEEVTTSHVTTSGSR